MDQILERESLLQPQIRIVTPSKRKPSSAPFTPAMNDEDIESRMLTRRIRQSTPNLRSSPYATAATFDSAIAINDQCTYIDNLISLCYNALADFDNELDEVISPPIASTTTEEYHHPSLVASPDPIIAEIRKPPKI